MAELLEILMIVSFGVSWPLNLRKLIKSKSTKGVSLAFYLLIFFGYGVGITSKFLNESYMANFATKWYVLIFYFFNFTVVGLNIIVYFRNRALEKQK
ncbi:MAG: hypothetical protein IKX77_01835 [Clostridia bacterium]|nr:hypothetical protein [Clostridia bacterium]MBR4979271.1 hypothetical protein [Clostridia bacterium]